MVDQQGLGLGDQGTQQAGMKDKAVRLPLLTVALVQAKARESCLLS